MARIELSMRAQGELENLDPITKAFIIGWMKVHLAPLHDPKGVGTPLGGSKRWQYRIGDYRLLARVTEKKITVLAITHGLTLPKIGSLRFEDQSLR